MHIDDVAISCSLSKHKLEFEYHASYYAYCAPFILLYVGEHDQGRLRFINFTYIFSTAGRLEIYLNGHWGTICSVGFGPEDAILACNQLGYRTYRRYGTVGQLGWVYRGGYRAVKGGGNFTRLCTISMRKRLTTPTFGIS